MIPGANERLRLMLLTEIRDVTNLPVYHPDRDEGRDDTCDKLNRINRARWDLDVCGSSAQKYQERDLHAASFRSLEYLFYQERKEEMSAVKI